MYIDHRPTKIINLIETVATVYASMEKQAAIVAAIDPTFDTAAHKPTSNIELVMPTRQQQDNTSCIASVSDHVKLTVHGKNYRRVLSDYAEVVTVTSQHRKQAKQAIDALQQHAVMQTLQGKPISAFIKTLTVACEQEQLPERDIGILCYVPRTVSQFKAQQKTANIKAEFTNSKQLGAIGEKVTANITIFAERNMTQWDSTLYEANDDKGNLITFFKSYHSKGDDYVVGQTYRITGKVKKAEASKYSFNAIVNTLNFVKIAK